jgi:putative spermidine/putrescine transport system permease protein
VDVRPGWFVRLAVVAIIAFLFAPLLLVAAMSFTTTSSMKLPTDGVSLQWYRAFFEKPAWLDGMTISFQVGVTVAIVATVLGTLLALGMAGRTGALWNGLSVLLMSPLIIPSIVVAVAVYLLLSQLNLVGTTLGLVIAHTALAIPYVFMNVSTSLRSLDPNLALAAASLGANPVRVFVRIVLPLILPGVFAGAVFAFIISWDEIVVATFITSPAVQTLPMVMWVEMRTRIDPTIAAASTMLTFVTALLLVVSSLILRSGRLRRR